MGAYNGRSDVAYAFAADEEVQVEDPTSLLRISGGRQKSEQSARRIWTVIVIGLLYLGQRLPYSHGTFAEPELMLGREVCFDELAIRDLNLINRQNR
jgi:hypothetical protein